MRTLIHEDDAVRVFEVTDDAGNVIGTDTESKDVTDAVVSLDDVRAKVAKVTNAATRDALTALLDALGST